MPPDSKLIHRPKLRMAARRRGCDHPDRSRAAFHRVRPARRRHSKGLFDELGPAGTVFLRVGFAALALLVLWRPSLKGYARRSYLVAVVFGLALAAMNFTLYLALDRIPLGVAVTLEFVGPLGVAVAGSRRLLDLLWAALAAAGILLLAPLNVLGEVDLDPAGVALALLAGASGLPTSS